MSHPSRINVLFVASEAEPLIKVGGLGDVAGSLPRSLRAIGRSSDNSTTDLDIRLVIPFHPGIHSDMYPSRQIAEYTVHSIYAEILVKAFAMDLDGLPVYLISGASIDQESGVYSANLEIDGYKYVFFSQAALDLARRLDWQPDILHANDWHTSAAVYSLALNRPMDTFFRHTASILTIHNLPYLGAMTSPALEAFELPPAENTSLPAWANHMALPLGLLTADSIVAVSPGYAKEIMTEEFGSGLHAFLRAHSNKLTGILNGLDIQKWDPTTDIELAVNYSPADLQNRPANKSFLQHELGLDIDPNIPLLAMVTRMDPQKGVDLSVDALRSLFETASSDSSPMQAVFLGTGDPVLEQAVRHLAREYPDRVCAKITYNERLSRRIYAGADILLMPSRYEPCGLSQMIAMRYGCVPVAHATGGLSDTIQDPAHTHQGTGFLFKHAASEALMDAIQRAVKEYMHNPKDWQSMQIRGMQQDFSWDRSAMEYLKQYKNLLENRIDHKMVAGKYV